MTVRLGTRGSALALAQAGRIRDAVEAAGETCELVVVRTEGDVSRASLAVIGGTGVFAGALREALRSGEVDLVVHSLKDLPVAPAPGLVVAGVPEREDARDALCARDGMALIDLPAGARIGTGSPRRHAQLKAARPDARVVDLRGNVDTRLGRVVAGDLDAVVLSLAGLGRLGRGDAVTDVMPLEAWPTAAGQGALAIEVREGDEPLLALAARLTDPVAHDAATAERHVLGRLEAGCAAPIGVASRIETDGGTVWAAVHRPDGDGERLERRIETSWGEHDRGERLLAAAEELARDLLADGAADLAPLGASA